MANFDPAFSFMIRNEDSQLSGVVTSEPNGGVAKWGINSKYHPNVDVAALTLDQAKAIYQQEYWTKMRGDDITSQETATRMLDLGVNTGMTTVIGEMQQALNQHVVGGQPELVVDDAMGTATLARINSASPFDPVMASFIQIVLQRYQHDKLPDSMTPQQKARLLAAWTARATKPIPQ